MIKDVLLYTDKALRTQSEKVDIFNQAIYLKELIDDMVETMYAAKGHGLAANQIGENLRLFVMDAKWNPDDTASRSHTVVINSSIKELWNPTVISEGCLSIPGAYVNSERYNNVVLEYSDIDNNRIEKEFMGLEAHVVQHEMEHLDGKLFIDNFKPLRKQMALNKHKKHMRLLKKLRR